MPEKLEGIVSPSIDNLLSSAEITSKYELVIFASKRARQINDYYSALQDGHLFQVVGPLVDTTINEKPLTIALKEIDQNKLAKKTGRTKSFYAREAIVEHLDDLEDLFLAEKRLGKVLSGKSKTFSLAAVEAELGLGH